MPSTLLRTKTNLPALRQQRVPRTRILDVISSGVRDARKLTLISAPAGFGKTMLARAWVETSGLPTAWLTLDEGDADPQRFLTYLVTALQAVIAGVGEELLRALATAQPPALEILLASLLNELAVVEDPFVLVLDDYHLATSGPVDALFNLLVQHLPPPMHLLITTREDPPLPLARLRARNQLTELRAADLRVNEREAAEFLDQVMGLTLAPEEVTILERRTEGWIAGLQLAALSMQGMENTATFVRSFGGTHAFVLDYLLEEVLHKQPETLQGFLLHTSILERLSGGLCDALWPGSGSGQATLEHLERVNLFVIPLDQERRWYRYHLLFRDLLRQRLAQRLAKVEVARIHGRASAWFEQNGEDAEAFQHAIAAEDFDRAARLAERSWLGMEVTFQTGAWLGWVKQLPADVIRVRPVLCTQMGWSYMDASEAEASESCLLAAERCLAASSAEMVIVEMEQFRTLPARIAIARAYNAQVQNRLAATVEYAEKALDLIPGDQPFMQAQATSLLSATNWANGELDIADRYMSGFVEAALQAGNLVFAVASSFGKADILVAQGRLRAAEAVYWQALELASTHGLEQFTAYHHLGLGLLYHEMGKDDLAARHLQQGFELSSQTTLVDATYRKNLAQARVKESAGDLRGALEALAQARRFYVRTPIPYLRPVEAMQARIYLKQGAMGQAQEWAQQSGLALSDDPVYLHEFEYLTLVRLALAEDRGHRNEQRHAEIRELLARLLTQAQRQARLGSQVEILLTLALVHHARREVPGALEALRRALQLAEPEGYLRIFADEGALMAALLADAAARNIMPAYVHTILACGAGVSRQSAASPADALVEPLSERERDVLRLVALGLSNQEISQKLFVALNTVKGHNLRIFAKLQAKSRTEAVARARELGLL